MFWKLYYPIQNANVLANEMEQNGIDHSFATIASLFPTKTIEDAQIYEKPKILLPYSMISIFFNNLPLHLKYHRKREDNS